jgi:ABC-type nitrate/sulfonate/bicarbonate transport system permease component
MIRAVPFFVLIIAIWVFLTEFDLVSQLYLPKPLKVINAMKIGLLIGVVATVARTVTGFVLGIFFAYFLHYLTMATNAIDALDAQFAASRAIPVVAMMPLFILWFGFGEIGRIIIVTLTGTAFYLAPLHSAFKALPREWTIQRQQLKISSFSYYRKIVLPGTLSWLQGALRLAMAVCFTIAIASDYMGAQVGIGKFIDTARVTFNVPGIFTALIVSAIIGLILDTIIKVVFDKIVHWGGKTVKA